MKKISKPGLIVMGALIVLGLLNGVINLISFKGDFMNMETIHSVTDIIMYLLVLIYGMFWYKTPHGNALRTIFFIFAIYILVNFIVPNAELEGLRNIVFCLLSGISALNITFIAGRLDKMEKNQILIIVTAVFLFASRILIIISAPISMGKVIGVLSQFIIWVALCNSYISRFEQHKAAGIEDK